eukprot:1195590-Prorocentrum_minimum.AAC.2
MVSQAYSPLHPLVVVVAVPPGALGWSADALRAGAKDIELSTASLGLVKRGEVELLEFFEEQCRAKLAKQLSEQSDLMVDMHVREKLATAVRLRLEMTIPYLSHWPQALTLQAQPQNVPEGLKLRAMLMDEIWFGVGDTSVDTAWYTKRAALLGVALSPLTWGDNSAGLYDPSSVGDAHNGCACTS